ncbi:MAG: DUF3800 domain-containing protein [Alphaproteobacteria bacterium]|nr:DUF3800 domain-containing protein [Alphaproteobacteria bacterium]
MKNLINVYCDETCHLQNRGDHVMVLGAVYCEADETKVIAERIRAIKKKNKLPRHFETKWTKISPSKQAYYTDLVDYFFNESPLRFRAVLIPDKDRLDHGKHEQSHDEWYYKMYYVTLKWIVRTSNRYHFYIDIKDTKGADRVRKLHDVLANHFYDFNHECIGKVQQIKSHESELMQLADLLIGAVGYANRFEGKPSVKAAIADRIKSHLPPDQSLSASTSYRATKFNLFRWDTAAP